MKDEDALNGVNKSISIYHYFRDCKNQVKEGPLDTSTMFYQFHKDIPCYQNIVSACCTLTKVIV